MPSKQNMQTAGLLRSLLVAGIVILLDQATKYFAQSYLRPLGSIELLGDWLRLTYTTNTGAAFGLLQNSNLLFALVAIIVVPLLLIFHHYLPLPSGWWSDLVIGLLLGGALGNLIDRIRQGYVTDFIDMGIGTARWPTYNIADSAFVIGAAIIIVWSLISPQQPAGETRGAKQEH